jgi:protein subunit release factor A
MMGEMLRVKPEDLDIRIINQRIGVGIGGWDTVMRLYHKPTKILIEVPRGNSGQFKDRTIAMQMLELALGSENWDF